MDDRACAKQRGSIIRDPSLTGTLGRGQKKAPVLTVFPRGRA